MANDQDRPGADDASGFNSETQFSDAADKARAKGAPEEDLEDLEAFLDAFEKDPEAAAEKHEPDLKPPRQEPTVADFSAPEHVEALVHGLLKDDDFNLEVTGAKTAGPDNDRPADGDATAQAPATKASSSMSTAPRPTPLTVASFGMSAVALLVAIGAGWAAFSGGTGAAADPAAMAADGEIAGLKKRVAALVAAAQAPERDLQAVSKRIDDLQLALESLEARLAPAPDHAPAAPAETTGAASDETAAQAAAEPVAPKTETAPPAAVEVKVEAPPAPNPDTWLVNLVSFRERAGAETALKRALAKGMDAQVVAAESDGRTWYRVAVGGFSSAEAARAYVAGEAKKAGYGKAWIAKP
jgi:hypothetical protein